MATHIVSISTERIRERRAGLEGVHQRTLVRLLLREWLLMSAEMPEIHRFMMHANLDDEARLEWLVDHYLRPDDESEVPLVTEAQKLGLLPAGDPIHMRILFRAAASSIFVFAAQFKLLTGTDARDPEVLERHIDLVLSCFEQQPD